MIESFTESWRKEWIGKVVQLRTVGTKDALWFDGVLRSFTANRVTIDIGADSTIHLNPWYIISIHVRE